LIPINIASGGGLAGKADQSFAVESEGAAPGFDPHQGNRGAL
jgi:hypothetical protein